MTRNVVVFGSTGVQGVSVVEALAKCSAPPPSQAEWRIVALTRNPNSRVAKDLGSIPNVICHQVAENNQNEPGVVFKGLEKLKIYKGDVYGVVSIQGYVDDPTMIKQGKGIAKASKDFGVQHFIYSSSDIGPPSEEETALKRKTFGFKAREIEPYVRELFPGQYTILRPTQFMDMILPTQPFPFRAGRWTMLRYTYTASAPNKIHQMISPRDIGGAAAKAFVKGPGWMNGVVRLAGWQGEPKEIEKIHQEIFGKPIQGVPWPLPLILKRAVPFLSDFCDYWSKLGYRVDIPALKQEMPELEDLRTYLTREKQRLTAEGRL